MIPYVVDASVGIKWFLPKAKTHEALRYRTCGYPLHVPEFFDLELTSVFIKKVRSKTLSEPQAARFVTLLGLLPLERHAELTVLPTAFEIAVATNTSIYDATYLALAQKLGGKMVTADEAFRSAIIGSIWEPFIVGI